MIEVLRCSVEFTDAEWRATNVMSGSSLIAGDLGCADESSVNKRKARECLLLSECLRE
jgi:hypothetical protein